MNSGQRIILTSEAINVRDVTVEVMSVFGKWDVDEQIENGQYLMGKKSSFQSPFWTY